MGCLLLSVTISLSLYLSHTFTFLPPSTFSRVSLSVPLELASSSPANAHSLQARQTNQPNYMLIPTHSIGLVRSVNKNVSKACLSFFCIIKL